MSVILGVKTDEHIFIAGDKRNYSSNGTFTDDGSKVFVNIWLLQVLEIVMPALLTLL